MLPVAIEEKSAGGKLRASLLVKVENEYGSYEAPIIATYKLTNIFLFEIKQEVQRSIRCARTWRVQIILFRFFNRMKLRIYTRENADVYIKIHIS